jgi:hypothetical protein
LQCAVEANNIAIAELIMQNIDEKNSFFDRVLI